MSRLDQGWKVNIREDWSALTCEVYVYRPAGDGAVEILSMDGAHEGHPVVTRVDANVTPAAPTLRLPYGCLGAMREAIDRTTGTAPDEGVTKQLRDDLAAERARVDLLIDRATRTLASPDPTMEQNQ